MKQPIVWLVLAFALVGTIYVLGVRQSYCEKASEEYCRRLGEVSEEAFQQCLVEATQECEARAAVPGQRR